MLWKIRILCTRTDYPINKVYIYLPGFQSLSSIGTPSACCLLTVLGTSCCSPEISLLLVLALAQGAGSLLRNDGCPLVRCKESNAGSEASLKCFSEIRFQENKIAEGLEAAGGGDPSLFLICPVINFFLGAI